MSIGKYVLLGMNRLQECNVLFRGVIPARDTISSRLLYRHCIVVRVVYSESQLCLKLIRTDTTSNLTLG
jgi:hypothetical protein